MHLSFLLLIPSYQAVDADSVGTLSIELGGDNPALFVADQITFELFLADPASCSQGCSVTATVTDDTNLSALKTIQVVNL